MDVCCLVVAVTHIPNARMVLKVQWVNMGFVESYALNIKSKIKITDQQFRNEWQVLDPNDDFMKCFRYGNWI